MHRARPGYVDNSHSGVPPYHERSLMRIRRSLAPPEYNSIKPTEASPVPVATMRVADGSDTRRERRQGCRRDRCDSGSQSRSEHDCGQGGDGEGFHPTTLDQLELLGRTADPIDPGRESSSS
jgi:hypothetical protein